MTPPIRVLIVDGAVVARRLIAEELAVEADIEVVGTAANQLIALAKLSQVNPDVVVLDAEPSDLAGLITLEAIRRARPELPVLMFSVLTERGSATTVDALVRGANDYLAKPGGRSEPMAMRAVVREQLLPKIRALGGRPDPEGSQHTPSCPAPERPAPARTPALPPAAVVVGVSTGGPHALPTLFGALPAGLGVPLLVVQHMPPTFTTILAERLTKVGPIPVREAVHGEVLEPDHAYLARGDWHMEVVREAGLPVLSVRQAPPENSCRPSVDVLFRSAARVYGPRLLGVVLTGMGQDGLHGVREILAAGGRVIAQDAASSVVWGMPGAVARAGLAEVVLPLDAIADTIVRRVRARDGDPAGMAEGR